MIRFERATAVLSLLLAVFCTLRGDSRISGMIDRISVERLREHVRSVQVDRNPYDQSPQLERTAEYIRTQFLKYGWDVKEDPVPWNGRTTPNLIAEKKGRTTPDRVFILGAHYDSVPGSPGADDNASAVAVLLEVGRNLQAVRTGSTVKLIAFALEECGYVGSTHYAERAKKEGERVAGMISLEMVGFTSPRQDYPPYLNPKNYPSVGDFIALVGNTRSEPFLKEVYRSMRASIPQLPVETLLVPGNGAGMEEVRLSDHSPFWDRGYPALMATDTAFLRNPHYHRPTDTIETLDFEFMRRVAAGILSAMTDLAK